MIPTWVMPLIMALLDPNGPTKTFADVILIGRQNGMTPEEEAEITDFYVEARPRRKRIADG